MRRSSASLKPKRERTCIFKPLFKKSLNNKSFLHFSVFSHANIICFTNYCQDKINLKF